MKFKFVEKAINKVNTKKPEILLAVGFAGIIVATVKACKASRHVDEILDEGKAKLDEIHEDVEAGKIDKKEASRRTGFAYCYIGGRLFRTFGPAIGIGLAGGSCVLASFKCLKTENAELAAKCVVLKEGYDELKSLFDARNKQFKDYRQGVRDTFGEEADQTIYLKTETKEIKETVVDEETGKKKVIKKPVKVVDRSIESPYVKIFDRSNKYWDSGHDSKTYMDLFFSSTQDHLTDRFRANGMLVLNDAYEALGFKMDKGKGLKCGWDKDNPNNDGYVQLTITKVYVVNADGEYEDAYAIDFNVDGCIADDE